MHVTPKQYSCKTMAPRKTNGGEKMTEEEMILLESSKHVSMATSALFYGNAFIVSVLPLCKQNKTFYSCLVFFHIFQGFIGVFK